jgi:outer membrane protein TolC
LASENWWEIFSDPQLNQFITVAIEQSPTMQRALARVEVVRQVAKEKRSILFPHIDLEASSNWQYLSKRGFFRSFAPMIPANVNDIFATLNLTYDLDLFGKNRHQFYAALDLFRAEQAESAETRLLLSAAVAKTYFELQANQERLAIVKNLANRRRALSHLHSMRRSEGVDNEISVLDADKNLLEIEKLVLGLEEAVTLNAHLLRTLMAENPDNSVPLPILPTSFRGKLSLPQNLSVDLLSRRPDLMAQIWRVEALARCAARATFSEHQSSRICRF